MTGLPAEWAGAVAQALTRFRFAEAASLARLAIDYPIAVEYAELLETYHHFMMQSHPASARSGEPFELVSDGSQSIIDERNRLQALWRSRWAKSPAENLYAFSYIWATCQLDGIRATMWLRQLHGHLKGRSSELAGILETQERGYLLGERVDRAVDIYVALEMARHARDEEASWPSPDHFLPAYIPTNILVELGC